MSETVEFMTHERIMTGEEYVSYSDYLSLKKECEEQARLLAMSAEREADLLGKLDRIKRAANNVILQWDSPSWKLTEPTAGVIHKLRDALEIQEQ
jgi:hypothetical protein